MGCNGLHQEPGGVAMQIEIRESTTPFDILCCQVAQQKGFAAAGFAEYRQVFRATALTHRHPMRNDLSVYYLSAKIESATADRSFTPARAPVPQTGKQLFEPIFHGLRIWVIASKTVTSRADRQSWGSLFTAVEASDS